MAWRDAIVVASGAALDVAALASLPAGALLIAADGGVDVARAMGLRVDVAVGDFDSVSEEGLDWARRAGAEVVAYPMAKDATDLELALQLAVDRGVAAILVLAASGGRLDHLLASASILAGPATQGVAVSAWFDTTRLHVITPTHPATVQGAVGDLVTLLPLHGSAHGVTTTGLTYPLHDEDLLAGTGRGVSNVLLAAEAEIHLRVGTLLAILPADTDPRRETA